MNIDLATNPQDPYFLQASNNAHHRPLNIFAFEHKTLSIAQQQLAMQNQSFKQQLQSVYNMRVPPTQIAMPQYPKPPKHLTQAAPIKAQPPRAGEQHQQQQYNQDVWYGQQQHQQAPYQDQPRQQQQQQWNSMQPQRSYQYDPSHSKDNTFQADPNGFQDMPNQDFYRPEEEFNQQQQRYIDNKDEPFYNPQRDGFYGPSFDAGAFHDDNEHQGQNIFRERGLGGISKSQLIPNMMITQRQPSQQHLTSQ